MVLNQRPFFKLRFFGVLFFLVGSSLLWAASGTDRKVENVAALELLKDLSLGETICLLGYYQSGDGGGGQVELVAKKNLQIDNGRSFPSSISGAIWKRVIETPDIDLKWFGAKGDGIADDSDALEAAANAAQNLTLRLRAGIYMISRTIFIQGSWRGDGMNSTLIRLAPAHFETPALVLTSIGYTAAYDMFRVARPFESSVLGKCLMNTLRLQGKGGFCPWGVIVEGFGVQGSEAKGLRPFRQNGLLVQQIAQAEVRNVRVTNMNGFGICEDSTQDMVFQNIHIEECGRSEDGNTVAAYTVGSFTDGGFSSASRVHHYYMFVQGSHWRSFETGNVGSRGPGLGGSSQNSWQFVHAEMNYRKDSAFFGGLLDHFLNCTFGAETIEICGPRNLFDACDFSGSKMVYLKTDPKETTRISANLSALDVTVTSGILKLSDTVLGNLHFWPKNFAQVLMDSGTKVTLSSWGNTERLPSGDWGIVASAGSELTIGNGSLAPLNLSLLGMSVSAMAFPVCGNVYANGVKFVFLKPWKISRLTGEFLGSTVSGKVDLQTERDCNLLFNGCVFESDIFGSAENGKVTFSHCAFRSKPSVSAAVVSEATYLK